MGAFDGELSALGIGGTRYGSVTPATTVQDKERIENVSVGDHVEWCTGFHHTGVIIGVFEQLVVIRMDNPKMNEYGGRLQLEKAMPKDYCFYRVDDNE